MLGNRSKTFIQNLSAAISLYKREFKRIRKRVTVEH